MFYSLLLVNVRQLVGKPRVTFPVNPSRMPRNRALRTSFARPVRKKKQFARPTNSKKQHTLQGPMLVSAQVFRAEGRTAPPTDPINPPRRVMNKPLFLRGAEPMLAAIT